MICRRSVDDPTVGCVKTNVNIHPSFYLAAQLEHQQSETVTELGDLTNANRRLRGQAIKNEKTANSKRLLTEDETNDI